MKNLAIITGPAGSGKTAWLEKRMAEHATRKGINSVKRIWPGQSLFPLRSDCQADQLVVMDETILADLAYLADFARANPEVRFLAATRLAPETFPEIIRKEAYITVMQDKQALPWSGMEANTVQQHDPVNSPAHYTGGKVEVIDFIEDKGLGFHLGNVVKYVARAGKKNAATRLEDLRKAAWYLQREIQREEAKGGQQ